VDRAGAALTETAPELRAGQADRVPQHPQQRHIGADVDIVAFAVYIENHLQAPAVGSW
jgi:hypothetical protein